MRILAIDTALPAVSVCVLDLGALAPAARETLAMERGHAEALLPMVQRVVRAVDGGFELIDRVAVTVGPGSFTGVRIGLAAAQGIALARGVALVGVSTLSALAAPNFLEPFEGVLAAAIDARNGQIYFAAFGPDGRILVSPRRVGAAEALRALGHCPTLTGGGEELTRRTLLIVGSGAALLETQAKASGFSARILGADAAADIAFVARLGLVANANEAPARPLYLKPPDAKPLPRKPVAAPVEPSAPIEDYAQPSPEEPRRAPVPEPRVEPPERHLEPQLAPVLELPAAPPGEAHVAPAVELSEPHLDAPAVEPGAEPHVEPIHVEPAPPVEQVLEPLMEAAPAIEAPEPEPEPEPVAQEEPVAAPEPPPAPPIETAPVELHPAAHDAEVPLTVPEPLLEPHVEPEPVSPPPPEPVSEHGVPPAEEMTHEAPEVELAPAVEEPPAQEEPPAPATDVHPAAAEEQPPPHQIASSPLGPLEAQLDEMLRKVRAAREEAAAREGDFGLPQPPEHQAEPEHADPAAGHVTTHVPD